MLPDLDSASEADRVDLAPRQLKRLAILSLSEFQRQHAHPDQVAAMDSLEALGDRGAHAEQQRTLGRPIARRTGAVLLTRDHDQRHAFLAVAFAGLENRGLLAVGQMERQAALDSRHELGPEPDM